MKRFACSLLIFSLSAVTAVFSSTSQADVWQQADEIVRSIQSPKLSNRVFTITEFGAEKGQTFDSNPAIQQAISAANRAGGGKVVIPAGTWFSKGPVHLKSYVNLHLEEGARLLFSAEPRDYLPLVKTRWEGTEVMSLSPLVYAANVQDVAITGKGTLDGNQQSKFFDWIPKAQSSFLKLREMGANGTPVTKRVFSVDEYLRPPLVQFFHAERVLLKDYKSVNSPFWVTHLVYANDVTIDGIRIDSHYGNNDGVDVESSSRVLIQNSWFRTGDDSVVIKSGRDLDGRTIGIPSTNIVVRNNDMGGEDGIAIGSEMSGGVKNVFFYDNVLREGDSAFRLKANLDRGGLVENIYIRDFEVESFKNLFWFQLNYPRQGKQKFPSIYKNIVFENINVKRAENVLEIHAPQEQPLLNVTFNNIKVENFDRLFNVENAKNIQFNKFVVGQQEINGQLSWQQLN